MSKATGTKEEIALGLAVTGRELPRASVGTMCHNIWGQVERQVLQPPGHPVSQPLTFQWRVEIGAFQCLAFKEGKWGTVGSGPTKSENSRFWILSSLLYATVNEENFLVANCYLITLLFNFFPI